MLNETHFMVVKPASTQYDINLQGNSQDLVFKTNNTERLRLKGDGSVIYSGLPTSSSGLAVGQLWNNGGILNIKQ